jgi:hypothetical protein
MVSDVWGSTPAPASERPISPQIDVSGASITSSTAPISFNKAELEGGGEIASPSGLFQSV